MNKTVKYMLGLGAAFLAGAGTVYVLTNDVGELWAKTKYVANKTQMAIIECDEALYNAHPKPIQKVMDFQGELMTQGINGMTKEEVEQKREEIKSDLDFKIKQYEKDKK